MVLHIVLSYIILLLLLFLLFMLVLRKDNSLLKTNCNELQNNKVCNKQANSSKFQ